MIPIQRSWMPPSRVMIQTMLGHPDTGSPKMRARRKINSVPNSASRQNINPKKEAMDKGIVENATNPSRE